MKAKRVILNSLKDRLRNNFNLAVSTIDSADKWQRATLAVATVGVDRNQVNSLLSHAVNYIERSNTVSLINYEMELI